MSFFDVQLSCKPLGACTVVALDGIEAMHELPHWRLVVKSEQDVDVASLVNQTVMLDLIDPEEESIRQVQLIIARAASEIGRGRERNHHLELSDLLWPLTQRAGYKTFQGKTSEQIVKDVIGAASPCTKIVSALSGGYVTWPYRVQYGESDWSFVARMLSDDGIGFWLDTIDGKPTIVLGDSPGAHSAIPKRQGDADVPELPFVGPDGTRNGNTRSFVALEWEEQVAHESVLVREFDIGQPDVYIDGNAGDGPRQYFEFPARVPDKRAADDRAQRRLEQLQRDQIIVRGTCDCIRLRPGRKLKISGDNVQLFGSFAMFEQDMVVASLHHRYNRPTRGANGLPYRANVTLRPTKAADGSTRPAHRPKIIAPVRTDVFESAVITGAGGEEIHVDEYGRVKLRFFWDRSGVADDKSSYWARTLQKAIAAPMFLPRVGWESVISYFDGVPDHPFVLGRVYNGTARTPYSLPAKSASTGLQSSSSPGGVGANEIRMSDDAGSEEFAVHAALNHSEKIGNNSVTQVGANEEHTVGLSHVSAIGGAHALSVGSTQTHAIGGELIINVDGTNTEIIGGAELINVTGNRGVNAGSCYHEIIAGYYGLQCNQSNTSVNAVMVRMIGGNHAIAAGLGYGDSVAGVRVNIVRGSRVVNMRSSYAESANVFRKTKAGPAEFNASGKYGNTATLAKITAGPTDITASQKLSISAKLITIKCSSLSAGNFAIEGSNVVAKGGTTEVDGATSRNAGGKVGG